jgi:Zn finger protein HypA/HybF involved in hydrogenase expression
VTCGFDAYVGALQFHHRDPATKAFEVSRQGITRSLERLRLEARKCVLLCANCHAMVEAGILALPVEAGGRG